MARVFQHSLTIVYYAVIIPLSLLYSFDIQLLVFLILLGAVVLFIMMLWAYLRRFKPRAAMLQLPSYHPSDRPDIRDVSELIRNNRAEYLNVIENALDGNVKGLIITGVKGVGKSSLAAYVAKQEDFWIDFVSKTVDLPTLLQICAQWLGDESFEKNVRDAKDVGEIHISMLCDRLQGDGRCMFFDNLETLLDEERRFRDKDISLFFERLLTSAQNSQIIITSRLVPALNEGRDIDWLDGVESIHLEGLKDQDGAELLKKGGVAVEDEEVLIEFSKGVAGNPLLLKILPPLVKRPGGEKYIENPELWKKFFTKEGFDTRLLDEAAQEGLILIFRISIIPDPVTLEDIKFLYGDADEGERWAAELIKRSLLEFGSTRDNYSLTPAVAETAIAELGTKPRELRKARRRATGMYLMAANSLKPRDEWKSLEDCQPYLRAFVQLIELGDFEKAATLIVDILDDPLDRWGHRRLLRRYYESLIEILRSRWWKARRLLEVYGQIVRNYGIVLDSLGDYRGAIERHKEHLRITRKIRDRLNEGQAYGNLGITYRNLGEYYKAIESHERHLGLAKEVGHRRGEGNAYGNLGNTYYSMGEYRKAIEFHEKHLQIALEIGDRRGEGIAYSNIGVAYDDLGEYRKAIEFHEKHLEIAKEIGDRHGEGSTYCNLGNAYHALGEYRKAIEFHEKHLKVSLEISDPRGEGSAYGNLGVAHHALSEYRKAIEFCEKHLELAKEIGDRRGEGNAFNNLGNAHHVLGEYRKAIEFYEKALAIAQEIGDRRGEGSAYGNLGLAHYSLGENDKAIEFHEKHLNVAKEIEDRLGEGNANGNLGLAYHALGEYRKAIEFHEKNLDVAKEIGDRRGEGNALGNLGIAYYSLGEHDKAIQFHEKNLDVAKEIGDKHGEGNAYGNLGSVYGMLEQFDKAVEYHQIALKISEEIEDLGGVSKRRFNLAFCYKLQGDWPKVVSHAIQGLFVALKIESPDVGQCIGLIMECREELGPERFHELAIESVGEEGAEQVDKILAQAEEAMKSRGEEAQPQEDSEGEGAEDKE